MRVGHCARLEVCPHAAQARLGTLEGRLVPLGRSGLRTGEQRVRDPERGQRRIGGPGPRQRVRALAVRDRGADQLQRLLVEAERPQPQVLVPRPRARSHERGKPPHDRVDLGGRIVGDRHREHLPAQGHARRFIEQDRRHASLRRRPEHSDAQQESGGSGDAVTRVRSENPDPCEVRELREQLRVDRPAQIRVRGRSGVIANVLDGDPGDRRRTRARGRRAPE